MSLKQTCLYQDHQRLDAKLVDFHGWSMPIHYGSQIQEHQAVRQTVGMFDVSHMMAVDCYGTQAKAFLQYVLANDVAKIKPGKALYTCMLDHQAGIIDDLIVYQLSDDWFRVIVNAGNRYTDVAWLQQHIVDFDAVIHPMPDHAIIAIQGPKAAGYLQQAIQQVLNQPLPELKSFEVMIDQGVMIARTGYTGEDGYELCLPPQIGQKLWQQLVQQQVTPCGLGARDTLRLEAGLNLYGQDMDQTLTPVDCGLGWSVSITQERDFIGKQAFEKQPRIYRFCGVLLNERGMLRPGQTVMLEKQQKGVVTSGGFSPILQQSIGFVRVEKPIEGQAHVEIRKKLLDATLVKLPFIRQGKKVYQPL